MNVVLKKICNELSEYSFDVLFQDQLTQESYVPTWIKWRVLDEDRDLLGSGWTTANPTSSTYLLRVPAGQNVLGPENYEKNREGRFVFMIVKPPGVAGDIFYTHLFQYWIHHFQGLED